MTRTRKRHTTGELQVPPFWQPCPARLLLFHSARRHDIAAVKEDAIMKTVRNSFKTGVAATVLLTGLGTAAVAQGFVGGFSSGYIGGVRSPLQITGSVVCSECSLEEVRQAQPQE